MQITGAERAAGIVYRERFLSPALLQRNGGRLHGDASIGINGLDPGSTGYATIELPPTNTDSLSVLVRATPSSVWNDNTTRVFVDTEAANRTLRFQKSSPNRLTSYVNGIVCHNELGGVGTWSDYWLVGTEFCYVTKVSYGASKAWLSGQAVTMSAGLFPIGSQTRTLYIGADNAGNNQFAGTIREIMIIDHGVDDADEPVLRNNTLISDILPDRSLINLPLERDYAISGVQSTPLEGTHKAVADHAIMGDGTPGGATVPTKISHRRHGYSFDGGDYIAVPDHADLSITDGVSDRAFTVALSCLTPFNTYSLCSKATGLYVGEFWISFLVVGGARRLYFAKIDEAAGAYVGRYCVVPDLANRRAVYVFTCDGGALASGFRIYQDAVRIDGFDAVSNVFASVQRSTDDFRVGAGVHASMLGDMDTIEMYMGEAFSPLQVKALTHRMEAEVVR